MVAHDCKIEIFIGYFWMRWVVIRAGVYCPHLWAQLVDTVLYWMSSFFSELNSISLLVAHWYAACRSKCRVIISSSLDIACPILVSSAKLDMNGLATYLSMSPISIRYRKGPISEPWGTPLIPSTITVCDRLLRKLFSPWPSCPLMPMASNFLRVIPMSSSCWHLDIGRS